MEIKRDTYLNDLVLRLRNGMIKVITGLRRCGKSYLMNSLFYRYLTESVTDDAHILRFAFDSAEDLAKIGEDPVTLAREKGRFPRKNSCVSSMSIFRKKILSIFCWMKFRNWIVLRRF